MVQATSLNHRKHGKAILPSKILGTQYRILRIRFMSPEFPEFQKMFALRNNWY